MRRIVEVAFSVIVILPNFSNCGYCPAGVPTITKVSKCPSNQTEWEEAATRKKCSYISDSTNCDNETPVYHCLLNQWRNETIEVCTSTWFMSGFCAVYNTIEMKVADDFNLDCTRFNEGKCPPRYISSEAYRYQMCYMYQNSSNAKPVPVIRTEETNDCILDIIIAVILSVLVLVIVTLVVFFTLRLKISKKAPDEECMLFCNATKQIVEISEEETPFVKNVNEENIVNKTKKTAESSSCDDPVESKQKPDTAETPGVDYSKPPVFNELRAQYDTAETPGVDYSNPPVFNELQAQYGGGKTRGQTPNESVTNSSNAKPKDKENAVPKEVFQKEVEPKVEHSTKNNNEFSSCKNLNNEENTDKDHAAEKENAVRKDLAADTENDAENEDDQKVDHTTKNDVEFSSHGNTTNEEKEDEDDQKVDHTTKNDVEFSTHENPTNEEKEDVNTQSPDSTLRESVQNTTNAKTTEYKQNADDKDDGKVSSDRIVQDKKKFWEMKSGKL